MSYEAIREETLARQKEIGIAPADAEVPPINPFGIPRVSTGADGQSFPRLEYTRPGDSLTEDGMRLFRRMADV